MDFCILRNIVRRKEKEKRRRRKRKEKPTKLNEAQERTVPLRVRKQETWSFLIEAMWMRCVIVLFFVLF